MRTIIIMLHKPMEPHQQADSLARELAREYPRFRREDIEFALLLAGLELGSLHNRDLIRILALDNLRGLEQTGGLRYRQLVASGPHNGCGRPEPRAISN